MLIALWVPYPVLELGEVRRAQSISLCDHGNEIHPCAQTLHHFNVERLQGMASGSDKVQACVNPQIDLVRAAGLLFLQHVRLVLIVQEFDDRLPGVAVVDIVTEARRVNDSQAD